MTRNLAKLFAVPYPVIFIEAWHALSGWPCFRVYLALTPEAEPTWDEVEHEHAEQAFSAARELSAKHDNCPIIDMTRDRHG